MTARSEPLLWLQLIAVGVLPLEALLLLLVLAGNDPGRLPGLERLLCWSIGGLAPALLLWRRPADPWSLLLAQTPLRGRRELQRRLSALQETLPLRLGMAAGAAALLPLLWALDRSAAMAAGFSPVAGSPRLVDLLLAALLLALMLWQWQQLLQAVWLLGRSPELIAATPPLSLAQLEESRLCLGLPLLLPDPLALEGARAASPAAAPGSPPAAGAAAAAEPPTTPAAAADGTTIPGAASSIGSGTTAGRDATPAAPVEPEQTAEQGQGDDLDQEVG